MATEPLSAAEHPPRGRLVVLSGAAGSGKSTIVARLLAQHGDLPVRRSISATTRAPRPGEADGVDYLFITVPQFEAERDAGRYLEWAQVHNHFYATPLGPIDRLRAGGLSVLLVIDVQGALTVRDKVPDALLVFVQAPSFDVLEQRLRDRQTDSEATITLRLRNARREGRPEQRVRPPDRQR